VTRKVFSHGKWIEVETVETPGVQADRTKPPGSRFTKFPKLWRQQLRKVEARGTTYEVAMVILDKSRWVEWVTLPNTELERQGVNRHAKHDAIKELEAAELIIVDRRNRKSPRVKALYLGAP
jgi:hypothetical protein